MPGNKWALHDMRSLFSGNTLDDPMMDAGGGFMKRAARTDDGDPKTDLVTRCLNAERTAFNEEECKISFHPDACVSTPIYSFMSTTGTGTAEPVDKYTPSWAGNGGVVVCGSANEVAPDPTEDDTYDVINRKVQSHRINYILQKRGVWVEVILTAEDQLCQKMGWALSKIFATSTSMNADADNTETNINVLDNYFTSCFSSYREVMKRTSFDDEMGEQLTFLRNKAVWTDWHRAGKLAFPDENYARFVPVLYLHLTCCAHNLHSIGLIKLREDGSPVLDKYGKEIANYEQKHIFTSAKVWTGFVNSVRRGNNEDLEWSTASRLDPLVIKDISYRDYFPKILPNGGYLGDQYPLCSDLPKHHFLKKNAKFRLLGGSSLPLSHDDPKSFEGDPEVYRLTLGPDSPLQNALCNPKNTPVPESSLLAGTGGADYDIPLGAPLCRGSNSECSSRFLLDGRVNERRKPNTIDECKDGSNTQKDFESVKRITVTSVKGTDLRGGELVNIYAGVVAFSLNDRVDFYYAADASNPDWKLITIVAPPVGESNRLALPRKSPDIRYTLPDCPSSSGCQQAVRVVLRSGRDPNKPSSSKGRGQDGIHKPNSPCPQGPFDDADDLVFEVLPSRRPQDMCNFQTIVTLDSNLSCHDRECLVDTVRVVEVVPGVFYEYLHVPCVHLPFYNDAVKIFAGWNGPAKKNTATMCANKKVPSAISTCCGFYNNRHPHKSTSKWADILSEYRFERLTYAGNDRRCKDWGRNACDPTRIGPFSMWAGQCLHRQSCSDVGGGNDVVTDVFHWTDSSCAIQVKVQSNGMLAIVHEPEKVWPVYMSDDYPEVQKHVNLDKTVSYFYVQWDSSDVGVGKMEYPNPGDNDCDGGIIIEDSCLCSTTVDETTVFSSTPTREKVLSELSVGAFDPTMFGDTGYTTLSESSDFNEVSVYSKNSMADFSTETVFRVMDSHSKNYLYLKNIRSVVRVCNGAFSFRNSPTFFDIVDPEIISAYHETDAYLDFVHNHDNTPPFVCKALIKLFGYSNASPMHIKACSTAFKAGSFTFTNPNDSTETLSYGDGHRGNLAAVAASIVLNNDAISPAADLDPSGGGIKSPLLKLMQVMRGLELKRSPHHRRTDGLISVEAQESIGETPYGNPGTFSFYGPDFSPAGPHREAHLVAPEAELLDMAHVISSQNAFYSLIQNGLSSCEGGVGPMWDRGIYASCGNVDGKTTNTAGYLTFTPVGDLSSSKNVVGQLATILTSDRINPTNRALIEAAYTDSYSRRNDANEALRVAQVLMVSIPEFHTTNKVAVNGKERVATPPAEKDENTPYKAIVSINLFGGVDSMSMLAPHPDGCEALYDDYKKERGDDLYLQRSEMVKIDASTSEQPCTSFGVNKHLSAFAGIYNANEGIFFTNIGHLQKPVNKDNFLTETTTQLFSHHTMKEECFRVDAFNERDNTGLLGRMHDVLGNKLSTAQISINKSLSILIGDPALKRNVDILNHRGADEFYRATRPGTNANSRERLIPRMSKLNSEAQDFSSINAELWSQSFTDAQSLTASYRKTLESIESSPLIPRSGLGKQLDMIYRLIGRAARRGKNRDVFACEMEGFDQHFSLKPKLNPLLDEVNDAIEGFRKQLIRSRLWDSVTVIVHSEFGRSITPNASGGTDHGWGGNYFMMGGEVDGGKILGHHPESYHSSHPHNTGRGAWIPTTANEAMWDHCYYFSFTKYHASNNSSGIPPCQYGVTQWFGITDEMTLSYVLPNVRNFGCELFSETDLYCSSLALHLSAIAHKNIGNGGIAGCGGDELDLTQKFIVGEPRTLNPDEQVRFCAIVRDYMGEATIHVQCMIQQQSISASDSSSRTIMEEEYLVGVKYRVTSDQVGVKDEVLNTVNTVKFQEDVAAILQMEGRLEKAVAETSAPTSTPTYTKGIPSKSPTPAPTEPTSSPSKAPTPSPSPKPTRQPVLDSFYGYEFVGEGECQDSHPFLEQTYNHLLLKSYTLPDDCPGVCAPYRDIDGFRGFEFGTQSCKCLFDKGKDLDAILATHDGESATISAVKESAQGSIAGVIPNANTACYRMAAIEAPEEIDGFQYVGYGQCLDDTGLRYDKTTIELSAVGMIECHPDSGVYRNSDSGVYRGDSIQKMLEKPEELLTVVNLGGMGPSQNPTTLEGIVTKL
ncbi:hypothetical protein ACHAXR_012259 [Thalassiosira sp. AJA248-18]